MSVLNNDETEIKLLTGTYEGRVCSHVLARRGKDHAKLAVNIVPEYAVPLDADDLHALGLWCIETAWRMKTEG